ncbi:MAG TPA: hypothetical protein VK846_02120 [Candidatus Limnocylindria bacterium]|nr:hypothetical protein [Candidatus Limnocylindria bacterium]
MLALLALSGCSHPRHSYSPTDEFFASGRFPVPSEFRRDTASRADVDAWSSSLLGMNPMEPLHFDIDGDPIDELFVSQPAHHGTGGNSYLIFRDGQRGFRYLGRLFFGALRPMATDDHGRARVLTSSWMGGGESMVSIQVLYLDGFRPPASRVLPSGDSATDGECGRIWTLLFDSESPTTNILRTVFGAELFGPGS